MANPTGMNQHTKTGHYLPGGRGPRKFTHGRDSAYVLACACGYRTWGRRPETVTARYKRHKETSLRVSIERRKEAKETAVRMAGKERAA